MAVSNTGETHESKSTNTFIYCIGDNECIQKNISKYDRKDFTETVGLSGCNLVIVLCGAEDSDAYEIIKLILRVRNNSNEVYIVGIGMERGCMEAVYGVSIDSGIYDIYTLDCEDDFDDEFVKTIINLERTEENINEYVGFDVPCITNIKNSLYAIENMCTADADNSLQCGISGTVENVSMLKYNTGIISKLSCDLCKIVDERNLMLKNTDMCKNSIRVLEETVRKMKLSEEALKKELDTVKSSNEALIDRANKRGIKLNDSFRTIYTIGNTKYKATKILYIKEISYVPYVNTLVRQFKSSFVQQANIRSQLVILDKNKDFAVTYSPMHIIGFDNEYRNEKERILSKDEYVMMEPNQEMLDDMLKQPCDILILYDRLGSVKDVVDGNNVTKYYVVKSNTEFQSIKGILPNITADRVISGPWEIEGSIAIPTIENYRKSTNPAKLFKYASLKNIYNESEYVFDIILRNMGIKVARR